MFGDVSIVVGENAVLGDLLIRPGNIFSLLTFGLACGIFTLLLADLLRR